MTNSRTSMKGAYSSRNPLVRAYFRSRLIRMIEIAKPYDAKVILDLGCGTGELLKLLLEKFAESECVGIDITNEVYTANREIKPSYPREVDFVRADCRLLPLREACSQLVFCASVLEHLHEVLPALLEIERVLEYGGSLVVGIPTENFLYRVARKFTGFRKPIDHLHEATSIERAVESKLKGLCLRKLPISFFPTFLSLYLVLVYGKGRH